MRFAIYSFFLSGGLDSSGGLASPSETIAQLRAQNVEAIEAHPPFFFDADEATIKATAQVFRNAGIAIRSVHAPFGGDNNLSHLDAEKRMGAIETHKRLLRRVSWAGVQLIIVHPGVASPAEQIPEMSRIIVDSLAELVPVAEESGVKLALENMLPRHPGSDCAQLRSFVTQINSPWLGVCFDTGHAHVSAKMTGAFTSSAAGFEILKDLVITFHLHDNDGTRDMHLPPGYGTVNWNDFAASLRAMNFREPITIESPSWAGAGFAHLQRATDALLTHGQLTLNGWLVRCPQCGHQLFGTAEDAFCLCGESKAQ